MVDKIVNAALIGSAAAIVFALAFQFYIFWGPCAEKAFTGDRCRNADHRVEVVGGVAFCRCEGTPLKPGAD